MSRAAGVVPATAESAAPLLRVRQLSKTFAETVALDDVSLEVRSGEILSIIGHNGSGKSTLVKILAGVYRQDAGVVELGQRDAEEPTEIHFIHQDLGLIPDLTAVENLHLVKHTGRRGLGALRGRRERDAATALFRRFGASIDMTVPVGVLPPAQRTIVALARAMAEWRHDRNVLVLDEPTEALHASEVERLFAAVRALVAEGTGVIFISHRLDEVRALADRVIVLRNGRKVADEPCAGLTTDALTAHLVGEQRIAQTTRESTVDPRGDEVLHIRGLSATTLRNLDLHVRAGEVVGIAGVLGSGREEVPASIFGAIPCEIESFAVAGREVVDRRPAASIKAGLAFVPGDRARHGAVTAMTARENLTLPNLRSLTRRLGVDRRAERREVSRLLADFDVYPRATEQLFGIFSGGNQQKIVFAKWLRDAPKVLLLEEPTQGVDVGAKAAIYRAIGGAARDGAGVIVCSSDDKELLQLCDRVVVLRHGRIGVELSGDDLTLERLIGETHGLASRPVNDLTVDHA